LASEYYNAALEIRPGSVEAWYGLGMLAQENRADSVALACYANIKRIDPGNPLGWYNTGYVLLELRDQPVQARAEFRRAIQLLPTWPEAFYNHGLTYELVDQLDSALVDYRKALALAPDMTLAAQGLERLQAKGVQVMR
jgi:tetratricopeptide (TPR) repeat protein